MRILSMTATFGKLEGQTLTLEPGLNVITAPNEWGKSTWCAFIAAMLYGIDTRERTKKESLADKERYAPWSGKPMSGRMDILWNGRRITLERSTKGRSIFGAFRAYETESGLEVPELTAEDCGQTLLGVEKSVFLRSGFLRLADMPVTDDQALRRRLNALVTTGDESGASDKLAQKLKELKNQCRHNRTGLLPQAEAQRVALENELIQLRALSSQAEQMGQQLKELEGHTRLLENHRDALAHEASRQDALRVAEAEARRAQLRQQLNALQSQCEALPEKEAALDSLRRLEALQAQWAALQEEVLPPPPQKPETPAPFAGISCPQAVQQAKSDKSAYDMLTRPLSPLLWILAAVFAVAGVALCLVSWVLLLPCLALAAVFTAAHLRSRAAQRRDRTNVCTRYGPLAPEQWIPLALQYEKDHAAYQQQQARHDALCTDWEQRRTALQRTMEELTKGTPLNDCLAQYRNAIAQQDALAHMQQACAQAEEHTRALQSVARQASPPAFEDRLTCSAQETTRQLSDAAFTHRQLVEKLGQTRGQMQTLDSEEALTRHLAALNSRICRLEDTYSALTLAQEMLTEASNSLQRQFAPRLAKRAQALFEKLTGGRYDRLTLAEDLSLSAAAKDEAVLHGSQWRSDGTTDQLYLALRLAVAGALIPTAPIILDDALVRFDDTRLAAAMELLQEESAEKQVILFTCQDREEKYL